MKTFFITFASLLFKKLANELRDGFKSQVTIRRNLFFLHSSSIFSIIGNINAKTV